MYVWCWSFCNKTAQNESLSLSNKKVPIVLHVLKSIDDIDETENLAKNIAAPVHAVMNTEQKLKSNGYIKNGGHIGKISIKIVLNLCTKFGGH